MYDQDEWCDPKGWGEISKSGQGALARLMQPKPSGETFHQCQGIFEDWNVIQIREIHWPIGVSDLQCRHSGFWQKHLSI